MAPLRTSTPMQKKMRSNSVSSSIIDSIEAIGLIDSSDEEEELVLDEESEQSSWEYSSNINDASSQNRQKNESMESIEMSSEILDHNGNDVYTPSIEANYQPNVNAPQESTYKNVLLCKDFVSFIEQELTRVTEEIDFAERCKEVDKDATHLINSSQTNLEL